MPFQALEPLDEHQAREETKEKVRHSVNLILITVVLGASFAIFAYMILLPEASILTKSLLGFCWSYNGVFVFHGMFTASFSVVGHQCIGFLIRHLNQFRDRMNEATRDINKCPLQVQLEDEDKLFRSHLSARSVFKSGDDLDDFLDKGLALICVTDRINERFGSFLVQEIAMCLLGETCSLYLSSNALFALKGILLNESIGDSMGIHWPQLVLGIQNLSYFSLCLYKHLGWMMQGHELAKAYADLRSALFKLKRYHVKTLTEPQELKIDELIAKTHCESPLR